MYLYFFSLVLNNLINQIILIFYAEVYESFQIQKITLSLAIVLKNILNEETFLALAGVAQWIECWPVNQRVIGLIPSQGTYLGCGPNAQ